MKKLDAVRQDIRKIKFVIGVLAIGWLAFTFVTFLSNKKTSDNVQRRLNDTTARHITVPSALCPICDKNIREGQEGSWLSWGDRVMMVHKKCLQLPR